MEKRGLFFVIDGCEGAGKSTQLKLLKEHFGEDVVITREPGGSNYAEEIRDIILHSEYANAADAKTMFALFWAARADHLEHTIVPALEAEKTVISDRFDSTTFNYQLYGQNARDLEELFWIMRKEYLKEVSPDLYIFLDIDPDVALERKTTGGQKMNHFDTRAIEFHERVREGMQIFAKRTPSVIIDGSKSIKDVKEELVEIISGELLKSKR